MDDYFVEELKELAAKLGLRVEEGDEEGHYSLYKGDDYIDDVIYVEQFGGWTSYDPTEPLDILLDRMVSDHSPKKHVCRHSTFYVTFHYGRKPAPDRKPKDADKALLAAVVKLAPKLAPGAAKVTVDGGPKPKWTKLT